MYTFPVTYGEVVEVRDAIATAFAWWIDDPQWGPRVITDRDGDGRHPIIWEDGSPDSWTNAVPDGGSLYFGADQSQAVPALVLPAGLAVSPVNHLEVSVYREPVFTHSNHYDTYLGHVEGHDLYRTVSDVVARFGSLPSEAVRAEIGMVSLMDMAKPTGPVNLRQSVLTEALRRANQVEVAQW